MSKKTYYITFIAVFAAVGIALNLLSSAMPRIDVFGRISLVYAFCFVTGAVLGPWLGCGIAALADFLPAIIFPEGPWMPLITLSNALMAMFAGLIFKNSTHKSLGLKIALVSIITFVVCSLGFTAAGEALLYNMGMQGYYPTTTMLVNSGLSVFLATVVRRACIQWFWLLVNAFLTYALLSGTAMVKFFSQRLGKLKNGNTTLTATDDNKIETPNEATSEAVKAEISNETAKEDTEKDLINHQ